MSSLFDTPELLRLLLASPAVCVRLLGVARAPRAAALAELRERLLFSGPDVLARWLLDEMAGAAHTAADPKDAMSAAHAAYAAARLPVYGLAKRKRYESHTEWPTLKPRLLEAVGQLLRLPQVFQAAAVASVAPLAEAPDAPIALPPARVLGLLDAIDGTTCRVGALLAASIEVAPSLRATIGALPFGLGLQVQARDAALALCEPHAMRRHALALRAAFTQHGVRSSAAETEARVRALLKEALVACAPPPPSLRAEPADAAVDAAVVGRLSGAELSRRLAAANLPLEGTREEQTERYTRLAVPASATAARQRAVLEAALRAVTESMQLRFHAFLEGEADKAVAIAAAVRAAQRAPPSEAAAAQAALDAVQAKAREEAAAAEGAAAEELVEEEPLLMALLPEGGIGHALERSALEETAREARSQLAAAEEEERQRRFERMPVHPDRQRQASGGAASSRQEGVTRHSGASGTGSRRHSEADVSGRQSDIEASGRHGGGETEASGRHSGGEPSGRPGTTDGPGEAEGMSVLRRRAERAERRVRGLKGEGVMGYEETVRMARAFLHAPRGSREHRGLYDLILELRRRLVQLEEAGGAKSSSTLEPPTQRMPPPAPPRPRAHANAATSAAAAAPVGHVCTCACAKLVARTPLERALVGQLRHLLLHCAGTGVSAFPAPLAREPTSKSRHAPNGSASTTASASSASVSTASASSAAASSGSGASAGEAESLLVWACTVVAPVDTPWEGRKVRCTLRFCPQVTGGQYPSAPPELRVLPPRPYHPNIDAASGKVCMDVLEGGWSAGLGVLGLLLSFRSLLASPTRGDAASMPANLRAARLLLADPHAYRRENRAIAETMEAADGV